MNPRFSVVLATRDRPSLFAEALHSVLEQDFGQFEVIVVNDGSSEAHLAGYRAAWAAAADSLGERFSVHTLVHRPRGHGQSYSLNYGVAHARGEYVCFLDDDDKWTDTGHLSRAAAAIDRHRVAGRTVDLYMVNQSAWIGERQVPGAVWLEGLEGALANSGRKPASDGSFDVSLDELLGWPGFCHLNCLTVRRALYEEVGGMDEGIRWECDRDMFLRLVDRSGLSVYHPAIVSYHRVPDPTKSANMTTALGMLEKRLLQTRVLDKAALFSRHRALRAHARRHKAYTLKKIAKELADSRHWTDARYYAAQALGAAPGLGWLLFTGYCYARSLVDGDKRA